MRRRWRLLGADGRPFDSPRPGTLGGHRGSRIYGRLDCRAARRAIERGGYVGQRVFFADEASARAAGYRPCAVCLPAAYAKWKAGVVGTPATPPSNAQRSSHEPADSASTAGRPPKPAASGSARTTSACSSASAKAR